MKLVDVPDSKSGVVHPTCRFDSGLRQIIELPQGSFFNTRSRTGSRFYLSQKQYSIVFVRQSGLRQIIELPQGSFFNTRSRTGSRFYLSQKQYSIVFVRQSWLRLYATQKVLFEIIYQKGVFVIIYICC